MGPKKNTKAKKDADIHYNNMLQIISDDLTNNIKWKKQLREDLIENTTLESDEITNVTLVILEYCDNALSDLTESMSALVTLDSPVNIIDLKSKLRKCKQETIQLHKFGELYNLFCRIKDSVTSNTLKQSKITSYTLCFEELFDFLTEKWVNPAVKKDVEFIENEFLTMAANLAANQNGPPAARQDRPQHYGAMKFDKTDLPRFNGEESSYLTFRRAFQEGTDRRDVTDDKKCMLLAAPNILLDDKIRNAIMKLKPHSEQWRYLDEIYMSKARALIRVMKGYLEMSRIDKMDSRFVDFVHSHTATVREVQDIIGEDTADKWVPFLLTQLAQPSLPYKVREELGSELGEMNEPNNDKLMKIMIRLKGCVGNIEPIVMRDNGNGGSKGGNSSKKNWPRANQATGGGGKRPPTCFYCGKEHTIRKCDGFKSLSVRERKKFVAEKKICDMCFMSHNVKDCDKKDYRPCGKNGCDQRHSYLLHESAQEPSVNTVYKSNMMSECSSVFMAQVIPVLGSRDEHCPAVAMWDSGANLNLIRRDFAEKLKLEFKPYQTKISTLGESSQTTSDMVSFKMVDRNGNIHQLQAAVLDEVTKGSVTTMDPEKAAKIFNKNPYEFSKIDNSVDILLGTVRVSIVPTSIATVGETRLYQSMFGTGLFCVQTNDDSPAISPVVCQAVKIEPKCEDWFTTESLGIGPRPMCSNCTGCKLCAALQNGHTYIEMQQLKLIEQNLSLDLNAKRWTGGYSYRSDPATLPDNGHMAKKIWIRKQKSLSQKNLLSAFNKVFEDCLERGVFSLATAQELTYTGPVFYSSIVEAHKDSTSTPLRLCVNNSLRMNGQSLNDIMISGPAPANTCFHNLIKWRGYLVGCIADARKFYNTVLATERDQHLKRIWWSPSVDVEPKVYLTRVVNFGEKTAGTMAVTALRLTAEIFGDHTINGVKKLIKARM